MEWITVKTDWLLDNDLFNYHFDRKSYVMVNKLLDHGAYFSGGHARLIARHVLQNIDGYRHLNNKETKGWVGRAYINTDSYLDRFHPNDIKDSTIPYWKARYCDLDTWFHNDHLAETGADVLARDSRWSSLSSAGYAQEGLCGNTLFQVITRITGKPQDVLQGFDLINAMVYLDKEGIHFTKEWLDCETEGQLGISKSDKPNLLWRVTKWIRNHRLVLRPADGERLVNATFDLMQRINTEGHKMYGRSVTIDEVRKKVWNLIPCSGHFTDDQLLQLSILYEGYHNLYIQRKIMGALTEEGTVR